MSYEDYANHVIQKYRLAISIAVIRSKPENITLEDYVKQLSSNITKEKSNLDDSNISLCSDDFVIDETDKLGTNIDENIDDRNSDDEIPQSNEITDKNIEQIDEDCTKITGQTISIDLSTDIDKNTDVIEIHEEILDMTEEMFRQNEMNDVEMIEMKELNDSVTILENFPNVNDNESEEMRNLDDMMTILKNVDIDMTNLDTVKLSSLTDKHTNNMELNSVHNTEQNIYYVGNINMTKSLKEYRHTKQFENIYQNVANIFGNICEGGRDKIYDNDVKDISKNRIYNVKEITDDTKENRHNQDIKYISKDKKHINDIQHIEKEKRCLNDIQNIPDKKFDKDIQMNTTQEKFPYETHFSESQTNDMIIIDDKYIHGINDNLERNIINSNVNIEKDSEMNNVILQENKIINNSQKLNEINNEENTLLSKNNEKREYLNEVVFSQDSKLANLIIIPNNNNNNYNKIENNQNCNEISKEKMNRNEVKYIESDLFSRESQLTCFCINNSQNSIEKSLVFSQNAQNDEVNFEQMRSLQNSEINNEKDKAMSVNKSCTEFDKTFKHRHENELIDRNTNFDVHSKNAQVTKEFRTSQDILEIKQVNKCCTNFDKALENSHAHISDENNEPTPEDCANFGDNLVNMEVEEESQVEFVPFKVMEELNKIKNYLNKKNIKKINFDENSSDTGYRSDSQKNSLKTSQSSKSWLDQSAHSIFNYLLQCPLAATTEDIANEISEVLGQLIDKLHEEETYPTFLEEYLDSVQTLLSIVYGKNNEENAVMEKDETIQRILLLNISVHVQKYTIEKITQILENLHSELTQHENSYDTDNIDQVENICYIFHILAILLRKYKKTCQNLSRNPQNLSQHTQNLSESTQNLSQNTQNSQEDCILKKSSITDIWRKKWNPNYKEHEIEGSSGKKCILTNCCTILNKIVVDCMNEYSLISYSALKCFNIMQN